MIVDPMQWVNLFIATATNIGALYLAVTMLYWSHRLRYSRTSLRPLIFSLFIAKSALWLWTFLNIINIILFDESQPNLTLPARLAFLLTVIVQIRVTTRLKPAPVLPANLEDELDSDGRLVLIVEDNEPMARIYRRVFQSAGINAEFATRGKDALTIIEQEKPRMMIIDLGLPDMDGVELVGLARVAGYHGPIIAISGAVNLMDIEKLEPAAFVQVMSKPIRANDLLAVTRKWLADM